MDKLSILMNRDAFESWGKAHPLGSHVKVTVNEIELNGTTLGGINFTPVDGTFPNWKAVIPAADGYANGDGKPAFFNPDYVYDLGQMSRALGSKNGTAFEIHGWDSGSPHGVTFAGRDDCFAVIMPMRRNNDVTPWATARAIA